MARALGIRRWWYHSKPHPHYDIPKLRIAEIQSQTTIVTSKDIIRIIRGEYESSNHQM